MFWRTVVTKISKKAEAQKIYDDAIKDNKTSFLLEETKADIFQLHVGNLSSGAKCKVKITYIMELPVEDGKTKLTIPTTVAPRYTPAETDYKIAKKLAGIDHDFGTPAPLNFQMDILLTMHQINLFYTLRVTIKWLWGICTILQCLQFWNKAI